MEVAESYRAEPICFHFCPSTSLWCSEQCEVLGTRSAAGQTLGIPVIALLDAMLYKSLEEWSYLAIQIKQASRIWEPGLKPLLLSAEHLGEPNPIGHVVVGSLQSNSVIPWAYWREEGGN